MSDPNLPPGDTFRRLDLATWRQYSEVAINLHPRLTILTGANAAGKTTLLALLAKHLDWQKNFYGSPVLSKRGTEWRIARKRRRPKDTSDWSEIGEINYRSGVVAQIRVPPEPVGPQSTQASAYDLQIVNQQKVHGVYITSHRATSTYAHIGSIPTTFAGAQQFFQQFTNELRNRYLGSHSGKTSFAWFKESLIAAAVFGEGNSSVEANPEALSIWQGYQDVLRMLLPASLGFRELRVRSPEVVVEAHSGSFLLDESSGGLSALMELAWQIFLMSRDHERFVVLFDEPENHLHPSLQRTIIPSLLLAFPRVQFVVATHSPFVVTAVRDSSVYVLDYDEYGRVYSRLLDYISKAASADQTLRRVLGLTSTMPAWADEAFAQVLERYSAQGFDSRSLLSLRRELAEQGLEGEFPQAMLEIASRQAGENDE